MQIPHLRSQWSAKPTATQKEEAAADILNSPGFMRATEDHDKTAISNDMKLTVSEGQGRKELREKIIAYQAWHSDLFALDVLRSQSQVNPSLYRLLQYKTFAHVLSFEGDIILPDQSIAPLRCYNETFTLPIVAALLHRLADEPSGSHGDAFEKLQQVLINSVWHDNLSREKIVEIHRQIHNPELQKLPILIGTGYEWHSTQLIFYKNWVIYANRGAGSDKQPGWVVCQIGSKDKITPEWLEQVANRIASKEATYKSFERIKADLQAEEIYYCPMTAQRVGNCTYTSLIAACCAIKTLEKLSASFTNEIIAAAAQDFADAAKDGKQDKNCITHFARQLVLQDFSVDLKSAIEGAAENSIPEIELASIKQMASFIHCKINSSPLLGFKIGWPLWFEINEQIKKLCPSLVIHSEWLTLAGRWAQETSSNNNLAGENYSLHHLAELAQLAATNEEMNESTLSSLLDKLLKLGQWQVADDVCNSIPDDADNVDKKLMAVKKLFYFCINSEDLDQAERYAKMIPRNFRAERNKSLEKVVHQWLAKEDYSKALAVARSLPDSVRSKMQEIAVKSWLLKDNIEGAKELLEAMPHGFAQIQAFKAVIRYVIEKNGFQSAMDLTEKFSRMEVEEAQLGIIDIMLEKNEYAQAKVLYESMQNKDIRKEAVIKLVTHLARQGKCAEALALAQISEIEMCHFESSLKSLIEPMLFQPQDALTLIHVFGPLLSLEFTDEGMMEIALYMLENFDLSGAMSIAPQINSEQQRALLQSKIVEYLLARDRYSEAITTAKAIIAPTMQQKSMAMITRKFIQECKFDDAFVFIKTIDAWENLDFETIAKDLISKGRTSDAEEFMSTLEVTPGMVTKYSSVIESLLTSWLVEFDIDKSIELVRPFMGKVNQATKLQLIRLLRGDGSESDRNHKVKAFSGLAQK